MTSKFSIDNRELLQRISSGEAVVGIDFGNLIVRELAAFRLSAMDSEPYGFTDGHRRGMIYEPQYADRLTEPVPVYRHAQPAPVVPDGYVMVPVEPNGDMLAAAQDAYSETDGDIASTLRAAMLAAAPHDTPALNSVQSVVTVPGKWIPVSERMPEDRTQVILWDAEIGEVTSGHYSHKTQTFYHCGDAIENEITHWMAPPAAPQEVRGE